MEHPTTAPRTTPTEPVMVKKTKQMTVNASMLAVFGFLISWTVVGALLGVPLMLFAAWQMFTKAHAHQGDCPHCGQSVWVEAKAPGFNCPFCAKRIIVKPGAFEAVT